MTRYDLYEQFARTHLCTREARTVYFALVAQLQESWSATEIAALHELDSRDVAAVLEQYEAARIVEAVQAAPGRRYRWRSDMAYIFGDGAGSSELVDPVCLMRVSTESPYYTEDASGRRHLFCSAVCLSVFRGRRGPSRTVRASSDLHASSGRRLTSGQHPEK